MRRFAFCISLLATLCVSAGSSKAQTARDRIIIGSTSLELEMGQDAAVTMIAQEYEVKPSDGNPGLWHIREKTTPHRLVGSLAFDSKGKLAYISKHWTVGSRNYTGVGGRKSDLRRGRWV